MNLMYFVIFKIEASKILINVNIYSHVLDIK